MKKWLAILVFFLFIGSFASFNIALADNDDDYEHYESRNHDDDHYEEREYDEDYYNQGDDDFIPNEPIENTEWYIWSREISSLKGELPFNKPKNLTLENRSSNNEQLVAFVIPKQGEIFVPGKIVSKFLGAKPILYSKSRILEVRNGDTELIFRAKANIAYENMVKTPLPAKAFFQNQDVYLPISVVANGLGFSVEWDEGEQKILLQKMIQ